VPEALDSRTLSELGVGCVFASFSAGLVPVANQYAWCSAAWFESNARSGFVKSVYSFKIDLIKVRDDF
jgi:putative transposase